MTNTAGAGFCALLAVALAGCATPYQPLSAMTMTGGYAAKHIEGDVYRVTFSANGYSSRETAQTYWLYRCAELTIEHGYAAFEILSNINLVMPISPEQFFAPEPVRRNVSYVYVPIYQDNSNKPFIEADIRLLKEPFVADPPKVFDAKKLRAALAPIVTGEKCSGGNVCEHVHRYLFRDDKFAGEPGAGTSAPTPRAAPAPHVAPATAAPVAPAPAPAGPRLIAVANKGDRIRLESAAAFRGRPMTGAPIIGNIEAGAEVNVLSVIRNAAGLWYYGESGGQKGWLLSESAR